MRLKVIIIYSAVENDTQCVPVCNRWRLKAEIPCGKEWK